MKIDADDLTLRAIAAGHRAMLAEAIAGLLRIENEVSTLDEAQAAAREALDAIGEPD